LIYANFIFASHTFSFCIEYMTALPWYGKYFIIHRG
jgi:hypothetical protein